MEAGAPALTVAKAPGGAYHTVDTEASGSQMSIICTVRFASGR